jgi:hypothetical protein
MTLPVGQPLVPAFSSAQQNGEYLVFEQDIEYVYSSGQLAIPVAGQTGTPVGGSQPMEIVQLASPYSSRIVTFTLVRENAQPVIPAPIPKTGETLMSSVIKVATPKVDADGSSYIYAVSGRYVFAPTGSPIFPNSPMGMGSSPINLKSPGNFVLDQTMFQDLT